MQNVVSSITRHLVVVCLDTAETRLLHVIFLHPVRLSLVFFGVILNLSYTYYLFYTISSVQNIPENPCQPSPCGPYSVCREVNGHAVCSCQKNYVGNPPACRPECTISADCPQNKACINQKCADPCPGTCGINARCQVVSHNPICSCPPSYTGDPFVRCLFEESKLFLLFSILLKKFIIAVTIKLTAPSFSILILFA